jgi:acyl-coenzyme A synthetase/AMP-(fatty) acid ligase
MIPLSALQRITATQALSPAIIDENTTLTWQEYTSAVERCVAQLAVHLRQSRPIRAAFLSENRWELVVLMSAFSTLGVPFVGLDYTSGPDVIRNCLTELHASCLVYSDRYAGAVSAVGRDLGDVFTICLSSHMDSEGTYARLIHDAQMLPAPVSWPAHPYEGLGFTSGTSGQPKLVRRTKSFEARRLAMLVGRFGFSNTDTHLVTVPLYHASSPGWARIFLSLGATIVLGCVDDPVKLATLIGSKGIKTTLMVPPVLNAVVQAIASGAVASRSALRFIVTGGKHLSPDLIAQCRSIFGPVLHTYYGTTETGLNTMTTPSELEERPYSAGFPTEGSSIAILGPNDQPLRPGDRGRVAISSYMNMDGYVSQMARTCTIEGDTYIVTADYGWIDSDGRLTLTSREDGSGIEAQDVNMFALEAQIQALPNIQDACIMRNVMPDARLALLAAFVPKDLTRQSETTDLVEMTLNLSPHIGGQYVTRAVPVPAIPYSLTGKVRVTLLKERMQEAIS